MDFQIEDLIKFYDDPYDPKFDDEPYQFYIFKKKEFSELSSLPGERVEGRGNFLNHQKLTQRVLLATDAVFLISEAGTGKSGEMVAPAEYFLESKEDIDKVIWITNNDTLVNEIQEQVANVLTKGKYDPGFTKLEEEDILNGADPSEILTEKKMRARRIKKMKKNGWRFITPTKFAKEIIRDFPTIYDQKGINAKFSNVLFIIDEVHAGRMKQNMTVERKLKSKYRKRVKEKFTKKERENLTEEDLQYVPRTIVEYFSETNSSTREILRYYENIDIPQDERDEWIDAKLESEYLKMKGRDFRPENLIEWFQNKNRSGLTKPEIWAQLWRVFHTVDNSKIIIASASPMVNEPSEILHHLNLILPTFMQLDTDIVRETSQRFGIDPEFKELSFDINDIGDDESLERISRELEPFLRGKISYVSADTSSADVNTYYLLNYTEAKYYVKDRYELQQYPPISYLDKDFEVLSEKFNKYFNMWEDSGNLIYDPFKIRLYYEEMSEFQSEVYISNYKGKKLKINGKTEDMEAARQDEINISNFVFPNRTFGSKGYKHYVGAIFKTITTNGKDKQKQVPDTYFFEDVKDEIRNDISNLGIDLRRDVNEYIENMEEHIKEHFNILLSNELAMLKIVSRVMSIIDDDYSINNLTDVIKSRVIDSLVGWSPYTIIEVILKYKRRVKVNMLEEDIKIMSLLDAKIDVTIDGIYFDGILEIPSSDIYRIDSVMRILQDRKIGEHTIAKLIKALGVKFNILYYSYRELFENLFVERRGRGRNEKLLMSIKNRVRNLYYLRQMSVKFYNMVKLSKQNMKRNVYERHKMYEYFSFIFGSNMVMAMLCLNEHGVKRYMPGTIKVASSEGELLDLKRVDKEERVALFKGSESTDIERENIIRLFNHPDNVFGEYISIILVSQVGQAGISLLGTQEIDIINPQWNPSDTYQAVNRGKRLNSFDQNLLVKEFSESIGEDFPTIDVNIRIHCAVVNRKTARRMNFDRKLSVDYEAYKASVYKSINIDKISNIMKEHSISCLIHEERNRNEENGIVCYGCQQVSCENIKSIKGIDESTYGIYDIEDKEDVINEIIEKYFRENSSGRIEDIYDLYLELHIEQLGSRFFSYILSKSINEERIYYDRFGVKNFLKEDRGVYYISKRYTETNDELESYYGKYLLTTNCDNVSKFIDDERSPKMRDNFESMIDLNAEDILERLKYTNIVNIGYFLENIILLYIFEDISPDLKENILNLLIIFYPSVMITIEPTGNIQNPPDRNPTLKKRAKTQIESGSVYKVGKIQKMDETRIGVHETAFKIPTLRDMDKIVMTGEKIAIVHNFYIIPFSGSGSVSNIFKSEGKLRVLDFDRQQWRDASYAEYLIYNVGFQYRNIRFKKYLSKYTESTYLLPVNTKYRVAKLPKESNGRTEHTGIVISGLGNPRLKKELRNIINDDKFDEAIKEDLAMWMSEDRSSGELKEKLISSLKDGNAVVYYTGYTDEHHLQDDYPGLENYITFLENYVYEAGARILSQYNLPLTADREKDIEIALVARTSFMTPIEELRYIGTDKRVDNEVPKTINEMLFRDMPIDKIPNYLNIPNDY